MLNPPMEFTGVGDAGWTEGFSPCSLSMIVAAPAFPADDPSAFFVIIAFLCSGAFKNSIAHRGTATTTLHDQVEAL